MTCEGARVPSETPGARVSWNPVGDRDLGMLSFPCEATRCHTSKQQVRSHQHQQMRSCSSSGTHDALGARPDQKPASCFCILIAHCEKSLPGFPWLVFRGKIIALRSVRHLDPGGGGGGGGGGAHSASAVVVPLSGLTGSVSARTDHRSTRSSHPPTNQFNPDDLRSDAALRGECAWRQRRRRRWMDGRLQVS